MSFFKGEDLFGSGPHVFAEGPAGQEMIPRLRLGIPESGSISIGAAQLAVTVTGRLVADGDAALWSLIDIIKGQLTAFSTPGLLSDNAGHEWPDVNFVGFQTNGPFDRGRLTSVAYTALFLVLSTD